MKNIIEKQIDLNLSKNLLFNEVEQINDIDEDFLQLLIEKKQSNTSLQDDLIEFTIDRTLSAIYRTNQYIEITKEKRHQLKSIYVTTYRDVDEANVKERLKIHYKNLSNWLRELYPENFIDSLSGEPEIGSVVNSEYSADLHLQILNLQHYKLIEPIMDLGCGKSAFLAERLRQSYNLHGKL